MYALIVWFIIAIQYYSMSHWYNGDTIFVQPDVYIYIYAFQANENWRKFIFKKLVTISYNLLSRRNIKQFAEIKIKEQKNYFNIQNDKLYIFVCIYSSPYPYRDTK
jgi:hypothetical protein